MLSIFFLLVGVTCGIATQLLLDGHPALDTLGVLAQYEKKFCDPIRKGIEREGITMIEKILWRTTFEE